MSGSFHLKCPLLAVIAKCILVITEWTLLHEAKGLIRQVSGRIPVAKLVMARNDIFHFLYDFFGIKVRKNLFSFHSISKYSVLEC